MREKEIEAYLVRRVLEAGGRAEKLVLETGRGWPDRSLFLPGGRLFLVETKTLRGALSPNQVRTIAALRSLGFPVATPRSLEDVERLLSEI